LFRRAYPFLRTCDATLPRDLGAWIAAAAGNESQQDLRSANGKAITTGTSLTLWEKGINCQSVQQ
jgi:hypothetical protein